MWGEKQRVRSRRPRKRKGKETRDTKPIYRAAPKARATSAVKGQLLKSFKLQNNAVGDNTDLGASVVWAHVLALFSRGQEASPPSLGFFLCKMETVSLPGGVVGGPDAVTRGTWQGTQTQETE